MSKTIAVFGGSFNPPGKHHRAIAEVLSEHFDLVVVVPCGPRPDKPVRNDPPPTYRAAMVDMTFRGLPKVRVELFDLEASSFSRLYQLDESYRKQGEAWHVIGGDLLRGGKGGCSVVQKEWTKGPELWQTCRFAVIKRPGFPFDASDLPPHHRVFEVKEPGASSRIRQRVFEHRPIEDMVVPEVARYLERHELYRGMPPRRTTRLRLDELRPLALADPGNEEAQAMAGQFGPRGEEKPNLIVVIGGDGTMLRAIRREWRRRVPFYGINVGHIGFLLNTASPMEYVGHELVLQQLPLLLAETESPDGRRQAALAFNDAWVERATGQTAWLQVRIDGKERLARLVADGALVSTAAGSTAYARAMGAAALPLNTPALLLVGSNVLMPNHWKPAVLPLDSVVELTTLDPGKRPLLAYIDGVPQGEVRCMRVRISNIAAVEMAFDPKHDPAERLARLQFPLANDDHTSS